MPKFKTGNMWTVWEEANLFLITTNSTIKKNGALVMGAGIAKQARDTFPGLDISLGRVIQNKCGNLGLYHILISDRWPEKKLGIFQVKREYSGKAELSIIEESVKMLNELIIKHNIENVHLNYPGIGNGGLSKEEVEPTIMQLSEDATIWET